MPNQRMEIFQILPTIQSCFGFDTHFRQMYEYLTRKAFDMIYKYIYIKIEVIEACTSSFFIKAVNDYTILFVYCSEPSNLDLQLPHIA